MTRLLTKEEINGITDFIEPRPGLPEDTAHVIATGLKERLIEQLRGQRVYPEIIPELKAEIIRQYQDSLIHPGESVGVSCAQSIGEKQTQTTLNTFHKAGQSEKTMTSGVPRFKELLDVTRNPKIVNHTIHFTEQINSVQEARERVGHNIVGLTVGDLSESVTVVLDKEDEEWYDAHRILFGDIPVNYDHCVSFKLNMKRLFEFKLSLADVAERIEKEYGDLYCIFSPPSTGQLDVFVDTSSITLPEDRMVFIDHERAIPVYLEECVQSTLEAMYICGTPGISEVFYTKIDGEWVAETNGFNSKQLSKQYNSFKKLLSQPGVDYTRTISNNVWDIYEILDIEAARQFLIEEFMGIMEGINECHTMLLVERMTHNGTPSSITRYTLKKEECGPMGKASFEETMDNFLNAAAQGDIEPTDGVSASIICGKRAKIGTGMMQICVDMEHLPPPSCHEEEEDETDPFNGNMAHLSLEDTDSTMPVFVEL